MLMRRFARIASLLSVSSVSSVLIAVLFMSLAPASAEAQMLDRALFLPLSVAVIKVEATNQQGTLNLGTAVTIAPGLVVTNCHVTRHAQSIRLLKGGGIWPVTGQHSDTEHDLCYLKVPSWKGRSLELGLSPGPRLNQRVASIGYTGGVDMSFQEGEISALYQFEDSRILQTTASFTSGASGGALLDETGKLIGILTFRLRARSRHYYAVPADWIKTQFAAVQFAEIAPHKAGKAFWEADLAKLPYFLKVAPLEAQSKWRDLVQLTEVWVKQDPDNPEPWMVQGRAYTKLKQADDAIQSFERATRMSARHADGWYELGLAYVQAGKMSAARQAHGTLRQLDAQLADELDARLRASK